MAQPVIPLLEEAVHVMRRAPLSTWVVHWTGSVPFAVGLLAFWNAVDSPRADHSRIFFMALLLAVLLVWMNCRRAVFAGLLRAQWTGTPAVSPEWKQLVPLQSFLAATRLIALPVSLLVIFPLAQTVAFYRTAAFLSGSEDLHPQECLRKASRLAARESGRQWVVIAILLFFYLAITLNLAIVLGIAPQLIRVLTGFESTFSRSGVYFVENPLFVLLVITVSWIAFDPFVQAVWSVRAFHSESTKTGEDLRLALRRLAGSILVLCLLVVPGRASGISPEDLAQSIRQTRQAHEYDWRLPPASAAHDSWLVAVTDQFIGAIRRAMRGAGELIGRIFDWLREKMPGGNPGAAPAAGLHWSIYVLIGAVVLVAGWIVWRKRRGHRAHPVTAMAESLTPVQLDAEELSPDRLPEDQWIALGLDCLARGDLRLALRAFYLANLAWLGRREFIAVHPGKTNREYERELRRRGRVLAPAPDLFSANVSAFERVWYGLHEPSATEVDEFRRRAEEMKAVGV
jgi:hypothetical protein